MENQKQKIVFERDYTAGLERLGDDDVLSPEEKALVLTALKRQGTLNSLPYFVNDVAAARFDNMVTLCDELAKTFFCKLTATIDHTSHEALITLDCAYLDFDTEEFMDILRKMAAAALQVRLDSLASGFFRLTLIMPYFVPYDPASAHGHHYV